MRGCACRDLAEVYICCDLHTSVQIFVLANVFTNDFKPDPDI